MNTTEKITLIFIGLLLFSSVAIQAWGVFKANQQAARYEQILAK